MTTDNRSVRPRPSRRERGLLMAAALGAPLVWVFHLFGTYFYVPAACAGAPMWGAHLITLAALVGIALVALLSYGLWRERIRPTGTYLVSASQIGTLGLLLVGFFTALILMEAWPNLVTDPCIGLGNARA